MRIAVVGPSAPEEFARQLGLEDHVVPNGLGGTPVNALVLALIAAGHHVTLITASVEVHEVWRASGDRLDLAIVPYRRRARSRATDLFRHEREAVAAELSRCDVEVISAHWSYEFGWPAVTSGIPALLTVHDAPLTILRHAPDAYRLLRAAMAYRTRLSASHVVAVSPYLASSWRSQLLYGRRIAVIPNIAPALPTSTAARSPRSVILDIADSSARKNIRALIEAFRTIRMEDPTAELRLVGPGLEEAGALAMWAEGQGLDEGVVFYGRCSRQDVARHLREATVLCHAALEESQGMIFLEAMTAGTAVIAGARSGGVAWTLGNGSAGELVDVTDPRSIATGIRRMLGDPTLRAERVDNGRRLVEDRYSSEVVTDRYLVELNRCIAEGSRHGRWTRTSPLSAE